MKILSIFLIPSFLCLYPANAKKSSMGNFKEWVEKNVPKLQPDYNPNHGYEPYWTGGHWLYLEKELGPNETTTKMPLVCGEECNYLYTRIGKVCARTVDNKEYQQCVSIFGLCLGWWRDEFYRGFYTFDTYCKFLDAQCRTEYKNRCIRCPIGHLTAFRPDQRTGCLTLRKRRSVPIGWILVHEGECSHDLNTYFKPLPSNGPLKRLSTYFAGLVTNFQKAGLESPLRQRLDTSTQLDLDQSTNSVDKLSEMLHMGIQPNPYIARPTLSYKIRQYVHKFVRELYVEGNNKTVNK